MVLGVPILKHFRVLCKHMYDRTVDSRMIYNDVKNFDQMSTLVLFLFLFQITVFIRL